MKPIELAPTNRGFMRAEFYDHYGEQCSIQESSIIEPACIWLGLNKNMPPHHVTGDELAPRMHLTQEHVRALLPLLQHFVEHGTLP